MRFVIVDSGPVFEDYGGQQTGRDVSYVRPSSHDQEWVVPQILRWLGERCSCFIVDCDDADSSYPMGDIPSDDLLDDSDAFLAGALAAHNVRASLPKGGLELSPLAVDTMARLLRAKAHHQDTFAALADQVDALRHGGPHT